MSVYTMVTVGIAKKERLIKGIEVLEASEIEAGSAGDVGQPAGAAAEPAASGDVSQPAGATDEPAASGDVTEMFWKHTSQHLHGKPCAALCVFDNFSGSISQAKEIENERKR